MKNKKSVQIKVQNPKIFEEYFDSKCVNSEDFGKKYDDDLTEMKKHKKLFKLIINLNPLMKNKDYKEYRKKWFFKNGFGIFVIRGYGTYGSEKGLFECAVMDKEGLRCDTRITNDVIGYNISEDILKIGKRIMRLKWKNKN